MCVYVRPGRVRADRSLPSSLLEAAEEQERKCERGQPNRRGDAWMWKTNQSWESASVCDEAGASLGQKAHADAVPVPLTSMALRSATPPSENTLHSVHFYNNLQVPVLGVDLSTCCRSGMGSSCSSLDKSCSTSRCKLWSYSEPYIVGNTSYEKNLRVQSFLSLLRCFRDAHLEEDLFFQWSIQKFLNQAGKVDVGCL